MPVVAAIVAALFLALAVAKPAVAASRYTVMPYDTLFSIASRFHVPLPLLEQVNGITDPTRLRVGQVLIIPDATPPVTAARPSAGAPKTDPPRTALHARPHPSKPHPVRNPSRRERPDPAVRTASYVIRPGDTLYHLAHTHGTTVQAIVASNGLTSSTIRVGQVIRLPEPSTAPRTPAAARPAATPARSTAYPPAAQPASSQAPAARPAAAALAVAGPAPRSSPAAEAARVQQERALQARERSEPVVHTGVDERTTSAAVRMPEEPSAPAAGRTRITLLRHLRETALRYIGVPYRWGGTTPAGVDCSGLVYAVYSPYVAALPRTSYAQWTAGVAVDRADLAVGDLVFFNTDGSGASHVGIYVGDGEFVHSATTPQRVVIDRLDNPYYLTHYIGARRVV